MSFAFTNAKRALLAGELDFDTHDIRAALLMTNSNVNTKEDVLTVDAITLDEYDGANYVRKALASETVTADNTNNLGSFTASSVVWTALGAGTRSALGVLLFRFVTNDADSVPIAFIDTGGFPIAGNGGDLTIQWSASGILQTT
jgi:hypothetical protein